MLRQACGVVSIQFESMRNMAHFVTESLTDDSFQIRFIV